MEHKLIYSSEANCFEQALPLGNGTLGATVYGKCDRERISLNHDTLWSGKPRLVKNGKAKDAYYKCRQLVLENKLVEAAEVIDRDFTATWSASYLPMGNLYIDCPEGTVTDYCREWALLRGVVSVRYTQEDTHFEREYFVSHPDNCFVIRIKSDKPANYRFSADSPLKSASTAAEGALYLTGECPSAISPSYAKKTVPTAYDGDGIKFAAIARILTDGDSDFEENVVTVSGTTETTLILCAQTSYVDFEKLPSKPYY